MWPLLSWSGALSMRDSWLSALHKPLSFFSLPLLLLAFVYLERFLKNFFFTSHSHNTLILFFPWTEEYRTIVSRLISRKECGEENMSRFHRIYPAYPRLSCYRRYPTSVCLLKVAKSKARRLTGHLAFRRHSASNVKSD